MPPGYKHAAPLGLRHNLRWVIHRIGLVPRQIPNVLRYSCMFIEPGVLHDVVGILGNPTPTDSTFRFPVCVRCVFACLR